MNRLTHRIEKLEEELVPDPEEARRAEDLRRRIEEGRARVRALGPEYAFYDLPDDDEEPIPLSPDGTLDLGEALKYGRRRAERKRQRWLEQKRQEG